MQFAGVRTDEDFNVIGEPLTLYCKPALDFLPHPEACLLTGITPQLAERLGVSEAEFMSRIHRQLAEPLTCGVGYNNLRFDDEVVRYGLYRNFYDPYAREWQNGNSRWDIIDLIRAARALRPEGIVWPTTAEGNPDLRLEALTRANNLGHSSAHDALSDVYATIALARLVKQKQPRLYSFLFSLRNKKKALAQLKLGRFELLLHVSGRYPSKRNNLAVVVPLCRHPVNLNGIIVYDLAFDPEPVIGLSAGQIRQRLFTAGVDSAGGELRIPLKTVHVNKCPVLAPVSVLSAEDEDRLQLNLARCRRHLARIAGASGLPAKLAEVFGAAPDVIDDPDLTLYQGGFFSDADKRRIAVIRTRRLGDLTGRECLFDDLRLPEMLFRYRARNAQAALSAEEYERWKNFCAAKLKGNLPGGGITLGAYWSRLRALKTERSPDCPIMADLIRYGQEKTAQLGIADGDFN